MDEEKEKQDRIDKFAMSALNALIVTESKNTHSVKGTCAKAYEYAHSMEKAREIWFPD